MSHISFVDDLDLSSDNMTNTKRQLHAVTFLRDLRSLCKMNPHTRLSTSYMIVEETEKMYVNGLFICSMFNEGYYKCVGTEENVTFILRLKPG